MNDDPPFASRFEAFARLARAAADGECVYPPRILTGDQRRLHVRQTLREDHQIRIVHFWKETEAKFDKLRDSRFSFFRGTALLFYRDMAGMDAWMPTVLTLGDVHPNNFGVMPNAHNVPVFGVNDFDEAYYAPFTWDLRRGATGFVLAAEEIGDYSKKKQRRIARNFIEGYIEAIHAFADQGSERDEEMRLDSAPPLIRELIEDSLRDRAEWLADDYLDEFRRGFRSSKKLEPITARRAEFQDAIDRLVQQNGITVPERAGRMQVKDVAIRRGQGTASLGLPRYYILIEGPLTDGSDDLILEFKEARRSALAGLVPPTEHGFEDPSQRIAHAQNVQIVRGDVFYGGVELEDRYFIVSERSPYRNSIDLEDLSKSEWYAYAAICGRSLAHAHALSDELGRIEHDVEPRIVEAIGAPELFTNDMVRYAMDAAEQVEIDHQHFCEDQELGAFRQVDLVYR